VNVDAHTLAGKKFKPVVLETIAQLLDYDIRTHTKKKPYK